MPVPSKFPFSTISKIMWLSKAKLATQASEIREDCHLHSATSVELTELKFGFRMDLHFAAAVNYGDAITWKVRCWSYLSSLYRYTADISVITYWVNMLFCVHYSITAATSSSVMSVKTGYIGPWVSICIYRCQKFLIVSLMYLLFSLIYWDYIPSTHIQIRFVHLCVWCSRAYQLMCSELMGQVLVEKPFIFLSHSSSFI